MSLSFITGVHFGKEMLNALNHITYIYNPNWDIGDSDRPSFPVAFFHVKSIHEKYESKVSQKPMLFYNSVKNTNSNKWGSGSLDVVADNIIVQPKQYTMEVIVPYRNLSLLESLSTPALSTYQVNNVVYTGLGGNNQDYGFESLSIMASVTREVIKGILKTMIALEDFRDIDDWGTLFGQTYKSITSTKDFNKNSLEEMFYSRSILKMKMWDSWRYKYVVITGMDITKEGTEDGVYEANITLQEVPIMYMSNIDVDSYMKNKSVPKYKSKTVEGTGRILIKTLDRLGE